MVIKICKIVCLIMVHTVYCIFHCDGWLNLCCCTIFSDTRIQNITFPFQVPSGLIFKNETVGSEMIEILQILQDKYVPKRSETNGTNGDKSTVTQKIFLGGDQLSEERARCAMSAMKDGDTEIERLDGLIPKIEDWHAIRYMYAVCREKKLDQHLTVGTIQAF